MNRLQNLNLSVRLEVCFTFEITQNRGFLKYLNRTPNYTSRQNWGQFELNLKGCMHCCSTMYNYHCPNTDFPFCQVYNICLLSGDARYYKMSYTYLLTL